MLIPQHGPPLDVFVDGTVTRVCTDLAARRAAAKILASRCPGTASAGIDPNRFPLPGYEKFNKGQLFFVVILAVMSFLVVLVNEIARFYSVGSLV